ncbi:MAG TPA: hypothetical protein VGP46_06280, partial [Acidimicrobiales bacterium]|nr:hypothetical protein [Acidimicrobiales bacterium]
MTSWDRGGGEFGRHRRQSHPGVRRRPPHARDRRQSGLLDVLQDDPPPAAHRADLGHRLDQAFA